MKKSVLFFTTICSLLFLPSAVMANKDASVKEKILYVMDPHCGWCYGNHNNLDLIYNKYEDKIEFELIVGGMWIEDAPVGSPKLHKFIKAHTPSIIEKTGAHIDKKYYDLALDTSYTFSSLEPSAAIVLIKEKYPAKTFEFASLVQDAIFKEGKKLDELATYTEILTKLDMDKKMFKREWLSKDNLSKTQLEFKRAKEISYGYPSLFFYKDGKANVIAAGQFNVKETSSAIDKALQ